MCHCVYAPVRARVRASMTCVRGARVRGVRAGVRMACAFACARACACVRVRTCLRGTGGGEGGGQVFPDLYGKLLDFKSS